MSSRHEHDGSHAHHGAGHHPGHARSGARQPEAFDPARAALLDDRARFDYLPPARIIALLDAPHAGTVVDFGTGTGTFAIELAERRPDLTVIALDEQPRMLELLRAKPAAGRLKNLKPLLTDQL
ncbi:MAG TPA: class I SAM-dependent methyltransferase, partial [Candidatus Binataceae bacterium]|nr:class I SAM-dependent methyltransferase [Candidatus Binataceae bacterium]